MYYLNYDEEGEIIGFYSDEISPSIPINSIQISLQQWEDCLRHSGWRKVDIANKRVINKEFDLNTLKQKFVENYPGLLKAFRNTRLFELVYNDATLLNGQVIASYVLTVATLNSAHPDVEDLQAGLQRLRNGLGKKVVQADIDQVNSALSKNNFKFKIS